MNDHTHADHHDHSQHNMAEIDHAAMGHDEHKGHDAHAGHGMDHSGHELMFRDRFWVSLLLTIPVIIFSPMIQQWFNYTAPQFAGSAWITPILGVVIFVYGGIPFLQMARHELAQRAPGMMTLISLAISVAFVYSVAAVLFNLGESFFWELVTLIECCSATGLRCGACGRRRGRWMRWRS